MNPDEYLDALLNLPKLYRPIVSRDGRWVAWTWFGTGAASDVYAAPTDASHPPVRLTNTDQITIGISWTPDSRAVLVQQDHEGDERYRLFRVDLDTPEKMVPLTEDSPNFFMRGGQLHPNGRWLVYGANVDVATGEEIEPTWVYRHDLETGERVPLARPERTRTNVPQLNEAGTHILYYRHELHPAGQQTWLVDIAGRGGREILNFGPEVKTYASWFPDSVRAIISVEMPTHPKIGVWSQETSELNWLVDDPDRYIMQAYVPPGSDRAVLLEVQEARICPCLIDPETGNETVIPGVPGNLIPLAPVPDDSGEWIGQYYSAQQPTDIVRFSPEEPRPESFTSVARVWDYTPLAPEDLAPAQDFRWTSFDGLAIQGWLYRPEGKARGTVVYVHGGPTSHSEDRVDAEVQYYVSQGFNVLDPNYRGSTGFSLPFREAIKERGWGSREQEDIRAGIETLIEEGIAERGKVGMTGTSYGGYSAWCGITRFSLGVLAAAAPVCGMTDLVVDYETTRPDLRPYSEEMLGGSPEQVPERYHERSPINFVGDIKGKLLIVQGLQDPNVTPENVNAVEEALREAGVEYDKLAFEDEGHGILRPKNRKVLYPRLVEFFGEAFAGTETA